MWPFFFGVVILFAAGLVGYDVLIRAPQKGLGNKKSGPPLEDELLRYPHRLEGLEKQLLQSIEDSQRQAATLEVRAAELGSKEGREAIKERYTEDVQQLRARIEGMRRVLGLVWKTRSILLVRAHVAITARSRPALRQLPESVEPTAGAAAIYDNAATEVRDYTNRVEERARALGQVVPPPPSDAFVPTQALDEVKAEQAAVTETYKALREQMDNLADTLGYLADACRTREVVAGAPTADALEPGSDVLLDQVSDALAALSAFASVGDQALAELAVNNLAEGIKQLEQAGLDAEAERAAAAEVNKLLEQFQR